MSRKPNLLTTKKSKLPICVVHTGIGRSPCCCDCVVFNEEDLGPDMHGKFDCPEYGGRAGVFGICQEFEPVEGTPLLLWDAEKKVANEYTHTLDTATDSR